jgi:hypothetical protein
MQVQERECETYERGDSASAALQISLNNVFTHEHKSRNTQMASRLISPLFCRGAGNSNSQDPAAPRQIAFKRYENPMKEDNGTFPISYFVWELK